MSSETPDVIPTDSDSHASPAPEPANAAVGTAPASSTPDSRAKLWIGIGAVAILIIVGWLFLNSQNSADTATPSPTPTASASATPPAPNLFGPAVVDEARILGLPKELGHDVYWAGALKKGSYELAITADGSAIIRYLAGDAPGAGERALTVATYPKDDAYTAAVAAAEADGAMSQQTEQGLVVGKTNNAYNGYLAIDGSPFLVEAYSPEAGAAWKLLTKGKIVPITS